MSNAILDVNNIKTTGVLITRHDGTDTTHVTSVGHHDLNTNFELNNVVNLVRFKVELDAVADRNSGVGVSESTTIMRNNVRDCLGTSWDLNNFANLDLNNGDKNKWQVQINNVNIKDIFFFGAEGWGLEFKYKIPLPTTKCSKYVTRNKQTLQPKKKQP